MPNPFSACPPGTEVGTLMSAASTQINNLPVITGTVTIINTSTSFL
jgi:hypothetical protein